MSTDCCLGGPPCPCEEGGCCWYDMRFWVCPGAGEAEGLMPLRIDPWATDSGRRCEVFRLMLPGPGGSRRNSAKALAIGSDSSFTSREEGDGGPCRDGTRGSGMLIWGGTGGGGMEEVRSGKALDAAAAPATAPIPGRATPPNGFLSGSFSIGGGEEMGCGPWSCSDMLWNPLLSPLGW